VLSTLSYVFGKLGVEVVPVVADMAALQRHFLPKKELLDDPDTSSVCPRDDVSIVPRLIVWIYAFCRRTKPYKYILCDHVDVVHQRYC
jgi:hypothetical protein